MSPTTTANGATPITQKLKNIPVQLLPVTASVDEITTALAIAGGVIIKNAVSTDVLDMIE